MKTLAIAVVLMAAVFLLLFGRFAPAEKAEDALVPARVATAVATARAAGDV